MPTLNLAAHIGRNTINYHVPSTIPAQRLRVALADHLGLSDPNKLRLLSDGAQQLRYGQTLENQGVEDGGALYCFFEQVGGFIADGLYIKSPVDISQLSLEVVLTPGIAAQYVSMPGARGSSESRSAIEWGGSAKGGKRGFGYHSSPLQERETGVEGDGLAWVTSLDNNAAEGSLAHAELVLDDARAVVLAYKDVADYLTKALPMLGLDESDLERFFYVHYRHLIEHPYVAIRFVEQAVYEQLAPLAISPSPEVVTRVVMLFQSLSEADVAAWGRARARAQLGPGYWKDVIGVDERATDESLYRALEWRAIEIPAHGVSA